MSGEYISRKAVIDEAAKVSLRERNYRTYDNVVRSIPAADVVEVVRCKDCKYRAEDDFCTGRGWPHQLVADDGFCEKGKRT